MGEALKVSSIKYHLSGPYGCKLSCCSLKILISALILMFMSAHERSSNAQFMNK